MEEADREANADAEAKAKAGRNEACKEVRAKIQA